MVADDEAGECEHDDTEVEADGPEENDEAD